MNKTYTIYAFKEGNQIVYIGMTCNVHRRFIRHREQARSRDKPKHKWIRKQVENGTFAPHILFSNLSEEKAHQKERELLKRYNPIYNVLTYKIKPKIKPHRNIKRHIITLPEPEPTWMQPYINQFVRNYIAS